MNSIAIFSLVLLLCSGCASVPSTKYVQTEFRDKVRLTIIVTDDLSWLGLDTEEFKVIGYHHCQGPICTIWIPSGVNRFTKCVAAHEVFHVIYGLYHGYKRSEECSKHRLRY